MPDKDIESRLPRLRTSLANVAATVADASRIQESVLARKWQEEDLANKLAAAIEDLRALAKTGKYSEKERAAAEADDVERAVDNFVTVFEEIVTSSEGFDKKDYDIANITAFEEAESLLVEGFDKKDYDIANILDKTSLRTDPAIVNMIQDHLKDLDPNVRDRSRRMGLSGIIVKIANEVLVYSGIAANALAAARELAAWAKRKKLEVATAMTPSESDVYNRFLSSLGIHWQYPAEDGGEEGKTLDTAPASPALVSNKYRLGSTDGWKDTVIEDLNKRGKAESGTYKDPFADFIEWSGYRTRWGSSYTHLFDVQIWDSVGYHDNDTPTDFTKSPNAFRFACIGTSIDGHTLATERVGGLDLPLPSDVTVPGNIEFDILDYARMSIYNFFYAWFLNFYDPHKRRYVSGKIGKYKNIRVDVYNLYGRNDTNRGRVGTQDIVLTVSAYNCIPSGFPGMNLAYADPSAFSFKAGVIPADVYYDFKNPQSYTRTEHLQHLETVYSAQKKAGQEDPRVAIQEFKGPPQYEERWKMLNGMSRQLVESATGRTGADR